MKLERIGDEIDTYNHTLGSIAYIASQMRLLLDQDGNSEAVAQADETIQECDGARSISYDWDQQKQSDPLSRKGARALDSQIDKTLSDLHTGAQVFTNLNGDLEVKRLANELVAELFPEGVFPITSKPFTDEHYAVNEILTRLRGPFANHVSKIGLEAIVDQLEQLNEEFGERLGGDEQTVEFSEVEAARVEAEDSFHRLLIKVMHDYMNDLPKLNEMLRPYLEQEQRLSRYFKRRGTIPEVDPETGEPIDDGSSTEEPTADDHVDTSDDTVTEPA